VSRRQSPDRTPDNRTPDNPAAKPSGPAKPAQGKGRAGRPAPSKAAAPKGGAGRGAAASGGKPAGPAGQARPRPQGRHRLSAAERAAAKRSRQRRILVGTIATVLVVGGIAGLVVQRNLSRGSAVRALDVQTFPNQGRTHLSPGGKYTKYNSVPPTSGPHDPTPAPCGVSSQPIPNEVQVHDLEHGVIMVQYRPGLDQEQVQALEKLGRSYSSHVIVAPYQGLSTPVAVTAWTKLMTLDRADEGKIRRFIDLYRQRGPEVGIPCPAQAS
jgi:Protein of unknown function (DUF3105)